MYPPALKHQSKASQLWLTQTIRIVFVAVARLLSTTVSAWPHASQPLTTFLKPAQDSMDLLSHWFQDIFVATSGSNEERNKCHVVHTAMTK